MSNETAQTTGLDVEPRTVAVSVAGAALLGLYGASAAAGVLPRWLVFGAIVLAGGYRLLGLPSDRVRLQYSLYGLAGLLVVTPVLLAVPDALRADTMAGVGIVTMVFRIGNLILLGGFSVVGSVFAGLGYWVGERA
jgi:hypothetical protein